MTDPMSSSATSVWIVDTSVAFPARWITFTGCAAIPTSSVTATPIVLLPTSSPSARFTAAVSDAPSGKIKALQGGLQGLGAESRGYLLPQMVGETSGMRGREPPVIHRVETFASVSRVGFGCQEPGGRFGYSLERPKRRLVAKNHEQAWCQRNARDRRRGNRTLDN